MQTNSKKYALHLNNNGLQSREYLTNKHYAIGKFESMEKELKAKVAMKEPEDSYHYSLELINVKDDEVIMQYVKTVIN
jgi:hypothetical protein